MKLCQRLHLLLRDVALGNARLLERFKKEIAAALLIVLLGVIAFTGYRFYADRRAAAASALLASAKTAQEYQQVILQYGNTPAAADAYLLLPEAQRSEKKFVRANATLQTSSKVPTAWSLRARREMAMGLTWSRWEKTDEAWRCISRSHRRTRTALPSNGFAFTRCTS